MSPFEQVRRDPKRWQQWGSLAKDAPPFLAPEFFALTRPMVEGGRAVVVTSWSGSEMVGALPLIQREHTLQALRSLQSPGFDYWGSRAGLSAIWNALRADPSWSEIVFDKVADDSELAVTLPTLARAAGCKVVIQRAARHPYFDLPGFEARLKPKFRTNVKRCLRKAGEVALERIEVPTRAELDEAAAIEAMAWKAAAGSNIDSDPRARHLYDALSKVMGRRHRAALYFLRVAGKRIASLFAVEDPRTLFALKIGYDPAYASISPGHLLIFLTGQNAEARGLKVFDFVGREDDWKRKWTDQMYEHLHIHIYRDSPRGLMRYAMREIVKPQLPQALFVSPRSPLPRRCQRADILGEHSLVTRITDRVGRGFGIKRRIRGVFRRAPAVSSGAPSQFEVGSWVRVRDEAGIRGTLDARDRLRGLGFVPAQWQTCGRSFRVARHVRRIRDDHGRLRAVTRTVLLEGVDCSIGAASPAGCGRHCPLMYRDEWLEPATAPHLAPAAASTVAHARVREADEIHAGLDPFGRRDGVTFMPEMAELAGRRFAIAGTLDAAFECDRWVTPRARVYMLDGAQCTGAICGGGCDRACTLLWHEDWLVIENDHHA